MAKDMMKRMCIVSRSNDGMCDFGSKFDDLMKSSNFWCIKGSIDVANNLISPLVLMFQGSITTSLSF